MKTMKTKLPDKLYDEIKGLVDSGWFQDEKDIINEALRRFLDAHKPDIMEKYAWEDVDWGLSGKD